MDTVPAPAGKPASQPAPAPSSPGRSMPLPTTGEVLGGTSEPARPFTHSPAVGQSPLPPSAIPTPQSLYCPSATALGRETAVLAILDLIRDRGLSVSAACREAKVPRASFDRWKARYDAAGLEGLEDNYANCGRRPMATLDEHELKEARRLYLQTGSTTAALRMLAASTECSDETASAILKRRRSKHTITPTLRAQVQAVPRAVADWHKSPTRVKREAFITPRTLSFYDRAGHEQRILPGMLAERDDMSNNFIFWIDWPWGGDPCSDKYGVRIARGQNLLHLDVGSLRFLSSLMLVRLRDSYRADDIWQWVGQTYRDLGIPEIGERWERGIWQADKLRGVQIDAGHTDQATRLGGIAALGRRIEVSQSPTTKIIENRFRYFQRVCTTIPGQIGASRGEMEKVNQLWTQCRDGRRDPRDYFLSYAAAVEQIESKLQYVNAEPVEGSIYSGIPNEVWHREGGDQRMTRLRPDQAYLFSRDRSVVTVTKGHALIRVTAPDGRRQGWWFHHEDLWRFEGRKVAVYLDKQAPEAGATLVHADGREVNQVIGSAELVEGCPQFAIGLPADADDTRGTDGLDRRKQFTDAVRAEYRALGLRHTVARGSYASDGKGRSASRESAPPLAADNEPVAVSQRLTLPGTRAKRPAEPDLDEIERLEAEARDRGEIMILP